SPRLDALAYYNMVNGICVKKCLGEKTYEGGVQATLFKDAKDASFLVLWKEKGRQDVFLPLPDAGEVKVLRIDGSSNTLSPGGRGKGEGGVTLGVAEEPLLLLYHSSATALPERLGVPAAALAALPEGVVKGGSVELTFALNDLAADALTLAVPPGWTARRTGFQPVPAGGTPALPAATGGKPTVTWSVTAPENTVAREGRIVASLGKGGELCFGIPVTGRMSVRLLPCAVGADGKPGVKMAVRNNGREKQTVNAKLSLLGEFAMAKGAFAITQPAPAKAFFSDVAESNLDIDGGAEKVFAVPLGGVDPQTIYRVRATITDQAGRSVTRERLVAGFVAVPRCSAGVPPGSAGVPPAKEVAFDHADWKRSPVLRINEERQFFGFNEKRTWRGVNDLSAELRFLWDDQNLYVRVQVSDDVFRNEKQDGDIWSGDGLQFLIDPSRESPEKAGRYDYCLGVGKKGPQSWCNSSADSSAPIGEVPSIKFTAKPAGDGTGGMSYVVAIPWPRLAPFKPGAGRNLGLAMILNDDDGAGRDCFMGWFSGVHSKEVDMVGDLILGE
ncbi:MAG: sugar-binding protein, partial [Planctomycetota bacterium]